MARDILSEYGRDSGGPQRPRATSGGCKTARDVMNYSPPKGPLHIMNTGVGLKGGNNFGNAGTQGPKSTPAHESGSPGNHGSNKGYGTNRG
jgi:hypothetical protein